MPWNFTGYFPQQDVVLADGSPVTNDEMNTAFENLTIKIKDGAGVDSLVVSDGRDPYELAGDGKNDTPTDPTQGRDTTGKIIFYEVVRTFEGSDGKTYTAIFFDHDQDDSGVVYQSGANSNGFFEQSYFMAFISNDFAADLAAGRLYQSSFAAATPPPPGTVLTAGPILSNSAALTVVCFTEGTDILCKDGLKHVEDLAIGDHVWTVDGGFQPIRWIGSRSLSKYELAANPNLYPIRIRAGALGKNCPETDICVSPQHRILVSSKIAQRMFDQDEVLVSAKHLLPLDGVEVVEDIVDVKYFHFMFDDHQVVWADGAYAESFYSGAQGLKSLTEEARKEVLEIFPELENDTHEVVAARTIIKGRQALQMAKRHQANQKALAPAVQVAQF